MTLWFSELIWISENISKIALPRIEQIDGRHIHISMLLLHTSCTVCTLESWTWHKMNYLWFWLSLLFIAYKDHQYERLLLVHRCHDGRWWCSIFHSLARARNPYRLRRFVSFVPPQFTYIIHITNLFIDRFDEKIMVLPFAVYDVMKQNHHHMRHETANGHKQLYFQPISDL